MRDDNEKWQCLGCGWVGDYSDLVEAMWCPDDTLSGPVAMESGACPKCKSFATEPAN